MRSADDDALQAADVVASDWRSRRRGAAGLSLQQTPLTGALPKGEEEPLQREPVCAGAPSTVHPYSMSLLLYVFIQEQSDTNLFEPLNSGESRSCYRTTSYLVAEEDLIKVVEATRNSIRQQSYQPSRRIICDEPQVLISLQKALCV